MPGPLNRTITLTASTAVVHAIGFQKMENGTIQATSHGSVAVSDGTTAPGSETWTLSGAAETAIRNIMDGVALTRWRTARGIEAP